MSQNIASSISNSVTQLGGKLRSCPGDSEVNIAIVGCGAAGVATLANLVESLRDSKDQKYKISIFEKNVSFGSGLAYQCDSEDLLMNMVSSTTSISETKEADFWEWMLDRGH